jgi:hypothetical protein
VCAQNSSKLLREIFSSMHQVFAHLISYREGDIDQTASLDAENWHGIRIGSSKRVHILETDGVWKYRVLRCVWQWCARSMLSSLGNERPLPGHLMVFGERSRLSRPAAVVFCVKSPDRTLFCSQRVCSGFRCFFWGWLGGLFASPMPPTQGGHPQGVTEDMEPRQEGVSCCLVE